MANIDALQLPEENGKAEVSNGVEIEQGKGLGLFSSPVALQAPEDHAAQASPSSASPASGMASLRASPANGSSPGPSSVPTLSMPHPKKFTHSTINKKFLEKTSTSLSSQSLSASLAAKTGNTIQKPTLQTAPSHSRLVTAKLTAISQASTITGPGWSRPPSSVSSTAPTPSSATHPKPPLPTPSINHSAPQPAPIGKVIQPQPRGPSEAFVAAMKKDHSPKPVWGNVKSTTAIVAELDAVASDFPTAAEVAQGRVPKLFEKKHTEETAAQKQAVTAEEDTFRGVHLDPNAHHWDEMEEDDDNFLGGVIEFGDGRQYRIQPSEGSQAPLPPHEPPELMTDGEVDSTKRSETQDSSDQPVSKEERFADDFDRSWPRSRVITGFPQNQRDQYANAVPSSPSSTSLHSPQESSRVLFNERLNRLEPYSNGHPPFRQNVPAPSSYTIRRGSRSDQAASPTDLRGGRDVPPHVHAQGVQLLHKAPGSGDSRVDSARFRSGGDHRDSSSSPIDGSRYRDREPLPRDAPLPPPLSRTLSQGLQTRNRDHYNPYGLPNTAPPLPLPPLRDSLKDTGRQLPPHLTDVGPSSLPTSRTSSDQDEKQSSLAISPSSGAVQPSGFPSPQSPLSPRPPAQGLSSDRAIQSSTLPLVDIDEVRKAAMHSAAERARLRRQQEEEEREREKERARRKAAELEAKMKVTEQEKLADQPSVTDAQVVGIIEEAIQAAKSISVANDVEDSVKETQPQPQPQPQPHTLKLVDGPLPLSPIVPRSGRASVATPTSASAVSEAESWRVKTRRDSTSHSSSVIVPSAALPPHPLLSEMNSLDHLQPGDDLEIVDFSELGKLVGVDDTTRKRSQDAGIGHRQVPQSSRAVAADFFQDDDHASHRPAHVAASEEGSWRRKSEQGPEPAVERSPALQTASKEQLTVQIVTPVSSKHPQSSPLVSSHATGPNHSKQDENRLFNTTSGSMLGHHTHGSQRSPLTAPYREAPMSTLTDTMARIKGALDGLHIVEENALPETVDKQPKWLPPALRPKVIEYQPSVPGESFDITRPEPTRSPPPAWNVFIVKLPSVSPPHEGIVPQRQQPSRAIVHQVEAFSWNPPLMAFTLNDVLFREPHHPKGRVRYRVVVPRLRRRLSKSLSAEQENGPVVNLPPRSAGRLAQNGQQETKAPPNWRKTPLPPLSEEQRDSSVEYSSVLDTVSRSPPPEAPSALPSIPSLPRSDPSGFTHDAPTNIKGRSLSKVNGSANVIFYRDARVNDGTQPSVPMNFFVSSELEDEQSAEKMAAQKETNHSGKSNNKRLVDTFVPTLTTSKVESEMSQLPPERAVITPPPVSTGAQTRTLISLPVKESPSRIFDPEHLKAVWSQTSNQELPSVNSLEGIADDLTTVPFTLQDVKSEHGGTPPPSGSGPPSRMSIHEVTRIFQQVPTSSSHSPHKAGVLPHMSSPPHGTAPQPSFAYAPHMPASSMRTAYPYPSPMMSHTPSPTVMYPHMAPSPVPRPMVVNGPSSPYAQPMWVPIPGPPSQAPGPMIRTMTSPYPAQLMPYPSPGGPMYASTPPGLPSSSAPSTNGLQSRAPNMPMMSPVMQPAHPMYANSPVLMHSPSVVPVPSGHNYPGLPANQGTLRGGYDHAAGHTVGHPPTQPGSYTMAPNSFARPVW